MMEVPPYHIRSPALLGGRFANTMSFLVKQSSAAEGEDKTKKDWRPTRREKIGPCFCERLWSFR